MVTDTGIHTAVLDGLHRIAPEADLAALAPDDNVRETLDIDSFDFLTFLIGLHQSVGVEIPESDYAQLTTLSAIEHYLAAHANGHA